MADFLLEFFADIIMNLVSGGLTWIVMRISDAIEKCRLVQ
jgi:hypothetical protein